MKYDGENHYILNGVKNFTQDKDSIKTLQKKQTDKNFDDQKCDDNDDDKTERA